MSFIQGSLIREKLQGSWLSNTSMLLGSTLRDHPLSVCTSRPSRCKKDSRMTAIDVWPIAGQLEIIALSNPSIISFSEAEISGNVSMEASKGSPHISLLSISIDSETWVVPTTRNCINCTARFPADSFAKEIPSKRPNCDHNLCRKGAASTRPALVIAIGPVCDL